MEDDFELDAASKSAIRNIVLAVVIAVMTLATALNFLL